MRRKDAVQLLEEDRRRVLDLIDERIEEIDQMIEGASPNAELDLKHRKDELEELRSEIAEETSRGENQ